MALATADLGAGGLLYLEGSPLFGLLMSVVGVLVLCHVAYRVAGL